MSFKWNSIRLGGPAHRIVTKTVHKTLPEGGGGHGVKDGRVVGGGGRVWWGQVGRGLVGVKGEGVVGINEWGWWDQEGGVHGVKRWGGGVKEVVESRVEEVQGVMGVVGVIGVKERWVKRVG